MSRRWWSGLRSRLIASYVGVLVLALAAFGAAAVLVIDRDLRTSLDARLRTTAAAARNFVDVGRGGVAIDQHDREQLLALLGPQIDIAVLDARSGIVLSTATKPAPGLVALARQSAGLISLRAAGNNLRAVVLPIGNEGSRSGVVIAWASTDWIEDTDRHVAVAFAIAALVVAAVASFAGAGLARRALDDTFERQRRFVTGAAHELRAPLSVIKAEADLALRKPRDATAYQTALGTIASETEQMERLVSALLVAARAREDAGEQTIVDMLAIARNVGARLEPAAQAKHISIDVGGSEVRALGDAAALEQAVTAVVHNAVKHTPADGAIRIWAERRGSHSILVVRDNGPGFSDDALAHGLEWFWRGETGRSDDHATGLGLAIASSIARASGGSLSLANAQGGGAQITLSLPGR